jgi:hypothetical protein
MARLGFIRYKIMKTGEKKQYKYLKDNVMPT